MRRVPGLLRAWLHLAVLWAFAFAKPLFDVLADSPEFFVARGNTRADILIFAIGMVVVPPTVLVLVEAAVSRLPRVREALHLVFVGGLFAVFAVQLLDDAIGGGGAVAIALAVLVGAGAALAYQRTALVPSMLTVLSPAPLLFLLLFLVGSDVSKLVLPQNESRAGRRGGALRRPRRLPRLRRVRLEPADELAPRIDAERYPNLAALARDSTWYPNATTVNSQTTLAVPALLSGRRPTPDLLPIPADYPNNLFTLLGRSHDVHATETATEVCPGEAVRRARPRVPGRAVALAGQGPRDRVTAPRGARADGGPTSPRWTRPSATSAAAGRTRSPRTASRTCRSAP